MKYLHQIVNAMERAGIDPGSDITIKIQDALPCTVIVQPQGTWRVEVWTEKVDQVPEETEDIAVDPGSADDPVELVKVAEF
jgi:hypothetical protein